MVLHIPYGMSMGSTPQRHSRGNVVPGIDTTASLEKHATAVQYDGWLTPPQSAHESRRPSCNDLSCSASSTAPPFSMPPTPAHSVFSQTQFPQLHANEDGMNPGSYYHERSLSFRGLNDTARPMSSQSMTLPFIHGVQPAYDEYPQAMEVGAPRGLWQEQRSGCQGFPMQAPIMQATLYSHSPDVLLGAHASDSSMRGVDFPLTENVSSMATFQYDVGAHSYAQPLQLVDPSQVSPQDAYDISSQPVLGSSDHLVASGSASFESADHYSGSFDMLDAPSPILDYCDDDGDYIAVKKESGIGNPPTCRPTPRKQPKKRRNGTPRRRTIDCYGFNIEIDDRVDSLEKDSHGRLVARVPHKSDKKHGCNVILDNGRPCPGRFLRGEHLKRHMGSHAPKAERKFPCPLEKGGTPCKCKIGRSDNACDHFKTHMKLTPKNRRNDWYHWSEVRDRISTAYQGTAAKKIIANLERWLRETDDIKLQQAHNFVV